MPIITFKCSDAEKDAFEKYCDKKGVFISVELRALINEASGNEPTKIDINTLAERLKRLESKFESLSTKGLLIDDKTEYRTPKPREAKPREEYGELVTKQQASEFLNYRRSSLDSGFCKRGITAVERVNGNRGGLYSKAEILEKYGLS